VGVKKKVIALFLILYITFLFVTSSLHEREREDNTVERKSQEERISGGSRGKKYKMKKEKSKRQTKIQKRVDQI